MTLRVTRRHEMSGKHGRKTLKPGEKAGRNLTPQGGAQNGQAMRKRKGGGSTAQATAPCRAEGAEAPCRSFGYHWFRLPTAYGSGCGNVRMSQYHEERGCRLLPCVASVTVLSL